MTGKTRNTAFIILLCVLLCSIISCSTGGKNQVSGTQAKAGESENTAQTSGTEKKISDNLPENLNLNGRTVRILSRLYERYKNELTVDALTGDVINDAVYNRIADTQERLNVVIQNQKEMGQNAAHGSYETIERAILAGDDAFDIYVGSMFTSAAFAENGYWTDLYGVKYLDPSRPYWSQYYIQKAAVGKSLYTITGDLAFSMIRLLGVTFFNKAAAANYNVGDLYGVVNAGKWTIDKELGIVKDIYSDLNGNGQRDNDDLYGLGTSDTFSVDAYTSSFDRQILSTDKDNDPCINVDLDKAASIVNIIYNLCWNTTGVNTYHFAKDDGEMTEIANVFSQGRFIFMSNWLYSTETSYMRDMKDDYGIIPYPKYDEKQENYYTYANDQLSVFTIPKTVLDPSDAGAVLEALCSSSSDTVLKAYYEIALKSKYTRDSDSAKMLDLIVKGFKLDSAWMYSWYLNGISSDILRTQIWNKTSDLASAYASKEQVYKSSLNVMTDKFRALEEQ